MAQSAVKKRFIRCHVRTLLNLTENYDKVRTEPESSPYHFMVIDERGIKYIRIELNGLSDETKRILEEFRKKCPPSTICEVRVFRKYKKLPERITI